MVARGVQYWRSQLQTEHSSIPPGMLPSAKRLSSNAPSGQHGSKTFSTSKNVSAGPRGGVWQIILGARGNRPGAYVHTHLNPHGRTHSHVWDCIEVVANSGITIQPTWPPTRLRQGSSSMEGLQGITAGPTGSLSPLHSHAPGCFIPVGELVLECRLESALTIQAGNLSSSHGHKLVSKLNLEV